jgi:hypothetical protein
MYLEEHVVEAPGLRSEDGRHASLALLDKECEVDRTRAGVTSGPGLPGAGVRCMTVGTEGLAIRPGMRDCVNGLLARETEHLGHDGRASDLDEHDVIETDAVERVEERERALDFVRLDHRGQDIAHGELALARAVHVVRDGEDGTQVIGGMAPCKISRLLAGDNQGTTDGLNVHSAASQQSL